MQNYKKPQQGGTKVRWFEDQYHNGHFQILVEIIRDVIGQKTKKIVGTVFFKIDLKMLMPNHSQTLEYSYTA